MIDTISYICNFPLRPEYIEPGTCPTDFDRTDFIKTNPKYNGLDAFIECLPALNLNIRGRDVVKVQAELPKLIFEHNGRLIKTEEEYNAAILKLTNLLNLICEPPTGQSLYPDGSTFHSPHFTRVDLVWQYPIDIHTFDRIFSSACHPRVRRHTRTFENGGLTFPGTKVEIVTYDKPLELGVKNHAPVTRIEVRLKKKKFLGEVLGKPGSGKLTSLSYPQLYPVYREELLKFDQPGGVKLVEGKKIKHFLAQQQLDHPEIDTVDRYIQTKGLCGKRARELRRDVTGIMQEAEEFYFSDLLPEDELPEVEEVVDSKNENLDRRKAS